MSSDNITIHVSGFKITNDGAELNNRPLGRVFKPDALASIISAGGWTGCQHDLTCSSRRVGCQMQRSLVEPSVYQLWRQAYVAPWGLELPSVGHVVSREAGSS